MMALFSFYPDYNLAMKLMGIPSNLILKVILMGMWVSVSAKI
jgi:hypothetical protein